MAGSSTGAVAAGRAPAPAAHGHPAGAVSASQSRWPARCPASWSSSSTRPGPYHVPTTVLTPLSFTWRANSA